MQAAGAADTISSSAAVFPLRSAKEERLAQQTAGTDAFPIDAGNATVAATAAERAPLAARLSHTVVGPEAALEGAPGVCACYPWTQ